MESPELLAIINRNEDSKHKFKANVTNEMSLAQEMVAFSNSGGGNIIIGVGNDLRHSNPKNKPYFMQLWGKDLIWQDTIVKWIINPWSKL